MYETAAGHVIQVIRKFCSLALWYESYEGMYAQYTSMVYDMTTYINSIATKIHRHKHSNARYLWFKYLK